MVVHLLLHRDERRVRVQRLLHGNALHRPGALLDRLGNGVHAVDVDASMPWIFHPSFHREQANGIGPQHDMIDPVQPRRMRRDRQRGSRVVLLACAAERLPRQYAHSVQCLHIQPMLWMRRLGQERRMPGVLQRGERVFSDDAIGMEAVGLLEGADGVVRSRA